MERDPRKERQSRVVVQQATVDDVEIVQKLCFSLMRHVKQWSTTLDENWVLRKEGEEYIRSCITGEGSNVLKAVVNNKIAGFVIGSTMEKPFRLERKFADIDFFYVDPSFRRHGVGTALVDGFSQWCREQQVQVVRVETTYANEEGQVFYHKNGFHNYELVLEKHLE